MRRLLLGLLLLAGCSENRSEKLEQQYAMMERAGAPKSELCKQATAIAQAYLEADNEQEYRIKRIEADADCLGAQVHRLEIEATR